MTTVKNGDETSSGTYFSVPHCFHESCRLGSNPGAMESPRAPGPGNVSHSRRGGRAGLNGGRHKMSGGELVSFSLKEWQGAGKPRAMPGLTRALRLLT